MVSDRVTDKLRRVLNIVALQNLIMRYRVRAHECTYNFNENQISCILFDTSPAASD
jgi:hypothetical protein